MAAAYLNNAFYAPEVSEPRGAFPHSRNISTVSSATLHTSTTLHSPPTEPLLPPSAPGTEGYYEVLSRQSRGASRSSVHLRWDQSTAVDGTPLKGEDRGLWNRVMQAKLSRWKWLKAVLEAVIGIWSLYNTIRYFYAFTIYESPTGQSYSLALGTSTGLSFACLACAVILALSESALSLHGITFQRLLSARQWLHYISSFLLIAPAIVNFAAVFSWRNATDSQLMTAHRCQVDIDIIWSTSYTLCNLKSPSWGVWLTLSVLRLLFTLLLLVAHLMISSNFYRLKNLGNPRRSRKHKYHQSDSFHTPCLPPHMTGPLLLPHFERDTRKPKSTLSARSKTSSSPRSQVRLVRSRSSGLSGDVIFDPTSLYSTPANPSFNLPDQGGDTNGFVDRFRSLVAQYTRETEEALELARSEDTSSRHTLESPPPNIKDPNDADLQPSAGLPDDRDDDEGHGEDYDNDDIYRTRPPSALGYNELGMPYPPEQQIRMLNGYIRRMPTIESMGSREMGSSIAGSSMYTNRDRERERYSMTTNSRPPTRNNRSSWDSEAHSRTNSLSAQAGILAGLTSEVGELLRMENRAELSRSPASSGVGEYSAGSGASHGAGHNDYSSSTSTTSGSRSTTLSYHTATMSSTTSVTPVAVDFPPSWPPS